MPNTAKGVRLPEIIENPNGLYEGDLKSYFEIFLSAKNLYNPYHNFRHIIHVVWLCYNACIYYREILTGREMRNLLIAAIFHDYNHRGRTSDDDLNIELAIRALKKHILEQDRRFFDEIVELMRATKFPYDTKSRDLSLSAQILRDADSSQGLSPVWVQQIVFGLSAEMDITPVKMLREQELFFRRLEFTTDWAKKEFPQSLIEERIAEARALLPYFPNGR